MYDVLQWYLNTEVNRKDPESRMLAEIFAPTLTYSSYVDIIKPGRGGIAVLRIPEQYNLVVHSTTGDPHLESVEQHAASLVERLVRHAELIGAKPLALSNVIDWDGSSSDILHGVGLALRREVDKFGLVMLSGERANLGDRIMKQANVSGTMVSLVEAKRFTAGAFEINDIWYILVKPGGKAVYLNSDGIGTKTEFYERLGNFKGACLDSLAMKVDDSVKLAAEVKAVSDVAEYRGIGMTSVDSLSNDALSIGRSLGFSYTVQPEEVGQRLRGYNDMAPVLNMSGSAVSLIDEARLQHLPTPQTGDYLMAIRGKPNPRSNGITSKRKLMIQLFGHEWHKTTEGRYFLEYLAEPSIVFYPLFKKLLEQGLVSAVFHMSGGAYNGKLARPLAEHNLYVSIDDLFPPDPREIQLAESSFSTTIDKAYAQWPMGNDSFVTTYEPEQVQEIIKSAGLESKTVGRLEEATIRKGVELRAYDGSRIYFSGRAEEG